MRPNRAGILWCALVLVIDVVLAGTAQAQPIESAGVRALGMGGAFVAVADDASAVYWNPAGLAKGAILSAVLEGLSQETDPTGRDAGLDATRRPTVLLAIGAPALGLSYSRVRLTRVPVSRGEGVSSRNDARSGATGPSSLTADEAGVTVLQSLGDAIVVGATLKWVRGVAAAGTAVSGATADERLDAAGHLPARASSTFDADVGVLAVRGRLRAGLVARNLREPGFAAPDGTTLGLERQVRAGVAVQMSAALTVAVDADLRRTTDADGERRRRLSVGAEGRVGGRLMLRGGLGAAVTGPARSLASGGASVSVGHRWWLDGQVTRGSSGDGGWGVGLRFNY